MLGNIIHIRIKSVVLATLTAHAVHAFGICILKHIRHAACRQLHHSLMHSIRPHVNAIALLRYAWATQPLYLALHCTDCIGKVSRSL